MEDLKLMQFSPGSGCGCKISPKDLEEIIRNIPLAFEDKNLLVGNKTCDDAAVYDIGNEQALISTTDFFTPIVDDPFEFGYIAAVNAISDVYAMGGKPVLAISVLGWPLSQLPASVASKVLSGANEACSQAGISIAGGHSIDIPVPVFGLAVNGIIKSDNIKYNNRAKADCSIYLTKPIGIGILTTALKNGLLSDSDMTIALKWMKTLNIAGFQLGELKSIVAMTDVTGFGLGGHLLEICENSGINADIHFDQIPLATDLSIYISKKTIPGGTTRNFKSYGDKISPMTEYQKIIICDPQTSGGLLVIVENEDEFLQKASEANVFIKKIGETKTRGIESKEPYISLL